MVRFANQMSSSDQMSRGFIERIPANSRTRFRLEGGHNSTVGLSTYLLAFKLNSSLPILFAYQRFSFASPCPTRRGFLSFQEIAEDTTNSWNSATHQYTAPVTGTYYVDLGVVVRSLNTVEASVEVNGLRKFRLIKLRSLHTSSEFISKGGLVHMTKDDVLTIVYTGCIAADNMSSSIAIFLVP
ncbi:unnamed protein product [Dimorphilus gyrociliatus]|uniref:Uncharacterized protein n=1 Tax=Dimorphilus gyrociliatus TaxID=2664684 RepID=A0A7I8VY11_9ANNE|nr:unnamed protein product [Dimorphilus gyrociliatus]